MTNLQAALNRHARHAAAQAAEAGLKGLRAKQCAGCHQLTGPASAAAATTLAAALPSFAALRAAASLAHACQCPPCRQLACAQATPQYHNTRQALQRIEKRQVLQVAKESLCQHALGFSLAMH